MTPRFNAFLILSKDIELVVKSRKNTLKNIYGFHKSTKEVVQIDEEKDGEREDAEKDDEEKMMKR